MLSDMITIIAGVKYVGIVDNTVSVKKVENTVN